MISLGDHRESMFAPPISGSAGPHPPSACESIGQSDSQPSLSPLRVLWIDDQIEIGDAALRFLALEKFDVQCARTGSEGLRRAASEPHAGIILDLRLPDIPGLAVLQRLMAEGVEAPVLVVTGFAEFESAVAAMKLGAVDYKAKPLIGEDLIRAVRTLVSAGSPKTMPTADNPDRKQLGLLPLDAIARRLAAPMVDALEFVLLARSFRHLVGGSDVYPEPITSCRHCTPETTALGVDLLGRMVRAFSARTLPSLERLAQEVSIPADQVNRTLKAVTSSDFRDCRRMLRVRPAVPEIAWSHEHIGQIAYHHGYEWPGQLDRDFNATLLLRPTAFRRLFFNGLTQGGVDR
jgi:DNA-binding response OmpR family regulator